MMQFYKSLPAVIFWQVSNSSSSSSSSRRTNEEDENAHDFSHVNSLLRYTVDQPVLQCYREL